MKDRNGMDLTEAEDIRKRWHEYTHTHTNTKKDLNGQDNHNGVITDIQPAPWSPKSSRPQEALLQTKAYGGDEIPAELFKILKDDAFKVLQ